MKKQNIPEEILSLLTEEEINMFQELHIKIKEVNNVLDINTVIRKISDLGYMRVLVEGGSKLSASLLNENLIDEIAWFRASKIMGNKGINAISNLDIDSIENLKKFKLISVKSIYNDQLSIYRKK